MSLYNPELNKAIEAIQKNNAQLVCIQLPDGMKPMAKEIEEKLSRGTGAKILIWLGSNFGACDIPLGLKEMGVDVLISWGHNRFHKIERW